MEDHHQNSDENLDEIQVESQNDNSDQIPEQENLETKETIPEVGETWPSTKDEGLMEGEEVMIDNEGGQEEDTPSEDLEIEASTEEDEISTEEIADAEEVEEAGDHVDPSIIQHLNQHIEALVFASDQPITFTEIKSVLEATFELTFKKTLVSGALKELVERYEAEGNAIELRKIGGGYQFLSKPAYHATIGTYLKQTTKRRLSRAALETLSIVAYKQPATKSEIEEIRGVNCDYAMEKLLEKDLVEILGRRHGPGRPLEYGTSQKFMDYFGLKDLSDMPKLKEFHAPDNSVGEAAPIEEELPVDVGQTEPANGSTEAIQYAIAISSLLG